MAIAAVLAFAVLAGVIAVGRWERGRHVREELRGLRQIRQLVGPLDGPTLSAYRIGVALRFDCLLYRRGGNRFALELCFDGRGRLVEAIDRRDSGDPTIASLREEPDASTIVVDRALVDRLLHRLGAPGR
ncbi:MAG: hypothetical protein ABR521_10775 [Gaiellaceae bacterium]